MTGPYRRLSPLGQGGMGVVDLAEHVETGERVALKTIRVTDASVVDRQVGNPWFEAQVLANLARLHREEERLEEAGELFRSALVMFERLGDRTNVAIALLDYSNLLWDQGLVPEALASLERSAELCRSIGNRRLEVATRGILAVRRSILGEDVSALQPDLESDTRELEGGVVVELLAHVCRLGHLALARGASAAPWVERATALVRDSTHLEGKGDGAFAALLAAKEGADAGVRLLGGHHPESVPEAVRAWLARRGDV